MIRTPKERESNTNGDGEGDGEVGLEGEPGKRKQFISIIFALIISIFVV